MSDFVAEPQQVFLPASQKERDSLFEALREGKLSLITRNIYNKIIVLRGVPSGTSKKMSFICKGIGLSAPHEQLSVSASLAGEKYLFQAIFISKDGFIQLEKFVTEPYRLQRRNAYRIRIPESLNAQLVVKASRLIKYKLFDLSAKGCAVIYDKSEQLKYKRGDFIEGELQFPGRPSLSFRAEVRHSRKSYDESIIIGMMFNPLTPELEKKTTAIVMDIYRKLFAAGF